MSNNKYKRGEVEKQYGTIDIPANRDETPRYIYFFHNPQNNTIKIGFAMDVKARLQTVASTTNVKLDYLGFVLGDGKKEGELHNHFSEYRQEGEWFRVSEPLLSYISENADKRLPVTVYPHVKRVVKEKVISKTTDPKLFTMIVDELGFDHDKVTLILVKVVSKE